MSPVNPRRHHYPPARIDLPSMAIPPVLEPVGPGASATTKFRSFTEPSWSPLRTAAESSSAGG